MAVCCVGDRELILQKAGREIELVVLIDTLSLNSRRVFRLLRRLLYGTAAMTPKVSKRYLRADGMRVAWNLARRSGGSTFRWVPHAIPPRTPSPHASKDTTIQLESPFEVPRTTPSRDGQLPPPEDRLRGHCDLVRTACEYFRMVKQALGPTGAQCASHHRSWPAHNLYYEVSCRSACTNIERGDRKIRAHRWKLQAGII